MNHYSNYLTFCLRHSENNFLTTYKDLEFTNKSGLKVKIKKGHKLKLIAYEEDKKTCKIKLVVFDSFTSLIQPVNITNLLNQYANHANPSNSVPAELYYEINWNEEIPLTHFKNAEEAYKSCYYNKAPLTENLENFIFSRSAKYAAKYACDVAGRRLSSSLEKRIFKNYRYVTTYCIVFGITLTEDQEKVFLNDSTGEFAANYGLQKIKGRLPEMLHNFLIMKFADNSEYRSYWIQKYFESIK